MDEASEADAEQLAAILQDQGRATVVGAQTSGQTHGAQTVDFPDGSLLQVVTFGFQLPDGRTLEGQGVTPDVEVDADWLDYPEAEDPGILAALEVIEAARLPARPPRPRAPHRSWTRRPHRRWDGRATQPAFARRPAGSPDRGALGPPPDRGGRPRGGRAGSSMSGGTTRSQVPAMASRAARVEGTAGRQGAGVGGSPPTTGRCRSRLAGSGSGTAASSALV